MMDPHQWVLDGLTGGTSIQFLGYRGKGKTTGAMALADRLSGLQAAPGIRRRVLAEDTRANAGTPEYDGFATARGTRSHNVARQRIKFIDPRMGMSPAEQHRISRSLMEAGVGRSFTEGELSTLRLGVDVMNREMADDSAPDVLLSVVQSLNTTDYRHRAVIRTEATMRHMSIGGKDALRKRLNSNGINLSKKAFVAACQSVAEALEELLDGFDGIFGGEESMYDILTSPTVVLNLVELDDDAIPLAEMVFWEWRNAAIRRFDHNLMAHIEIHDEEWKRWQSPVYGKNMIKHLKKVRGSGVVIIKAMHFPSDVDQAGPVGSLERANAIKGLRETDVWAISALPESEHEALQRLVRLPRQYLDMLPSLGRGQFIIVIGDLLVPFPITLDDLTERELGMSSMSNRAQQIASGNYKGAP